ncbi:protein kinase domain-containing protein [Streptomyces sp. BH097]|uniref:protein kinase domain-containing protein n=1 Tax=unclassified Streptomyces TaxID=2593676 RepID=UPI003BB551F8
MSRRSGQDEGGADGAGGTWDRRGSVMVYAPLTPADPERVGRHRLVARLGQGGMGRVYLARSPSGRVIAVKVIRSTVVDSPGFRQRFVREVAAARRIKGIHTAAVVDADTDGTPAWLATEFVPGLSVHDAVATYGPWPEQAVRCLGAALAEALQTIHDAEVAHRDLKPSNVLLAANGPCVIDFGISITPEDTALTETGMVVGTPGFVPPEQLRGERAGPAGDVFALGAVLAYAATGAGPFGPGAAHAVHFRVLHQEPDLSGLPDGLRRLVGRCLSKDPGKRPGVAELVDEWGDATPAPGAAEEASWLPGPVATEIDRIRRAPLPDIPTQTGTRPKEASTPTEYPAVVSIDTGPDISRASVPADPADPAHDASARPGPLTRRRLLAGLAVAGVGGTVVAVNGFWAPGDKKPTPAPSHVRQLWSASLAGGLKLSVVADGLVGLGVDKLGSTTNTARVLDAGTGGLHWQRKGLGEGAVITSVSEGTVYYGAGNYLYAADAASGETRWKLKTGLLRFVPITAGGSTCLYFPQGLFVVNAATGKLQWSYRFVKGRTEELVAADGTVYLCGDRTLHAVSTAAHERAWTFDADSKLVTVPVVAAGTAYCAGLDGSLYAVDSSTGKEKWRRKFDGKLWDSRIAGGAGAPVVSGGTVYFENTAYVTAFRTGSGDQVWQHRSSADDLRLLGVAAGSVLLAEPDGTLTALDSGTGRRRWKQRLTKSADFRWSPKFADGAVYFQDGRRLRAVTAAD